MVNDGGTFYEQFLLAVGLMESVQLSDADYLKQVKEMEKLLESETVLPLGRNG